MEITNEQFAKIEHCLSLQCDNVSIGNLRMVNAILYVAEHGCKWRGLPKRFGNWHSIYTRINRWTKAGVINRMFAELQKEQILRIKIEVVSLDSTSIKVHSDSAGALKITARSRSESRVASGMSKFIWLPQMLEQP
jgi:transposase